jgi:glycosyltransferase involved in cell wall biosynthesis
MEALLLDLAAEPDVVAALRIAEHLRLAAPTASPPVARLLLGAVADTDPIVAIGAIHAVAGVAAEEADRVLVDSLEDARPWIREHAAWALAARRPARSAVSGLVDLVATGSDLAAMVAQRTLAGWSAAEAPAIGRALLDRFRSGADDDVRRRLVDALGQVDSGTARREVLAIALDRDESVDVRAAAVDAFAGSRMPDVQAAFMAIANEASPIATPALLAMFDLDRDEPDHGDRRGIRIGQLTLTGELDGRSSQAGAGDTGGIASLLVSVSHALGRHPAVESIVSIGRSSPDGELSSLLVPDFGNEGFSAVSFGRIGQPPALAGEWDHRLRIERGIRRALARRAPLDVLHLRMADVGTLAAASVARRLGIRAVFTCAPDPHAPIAIRQAAGEITRDGFGSVDVDEHLWFRARMVERLVAQADHLVLFPRPGVAETIAVTMGVDRATLAERSTVAPEGIDLANIVAAEQDRSTPPVVDEIIARLPPHRRGRPLVVSVGRLHPVKGMARVVRDWLADDRLTASTNLVIVGGDLERPNPAERRVVQEIGEMLDGHPAAAGVVLLGFREPAVVAQVLVATVVGVGDEIAAGGVYVNGAPKEEFGLALLEALAAGLPVVAPSEGGPSTYVEAAVTGVLVGADDDLGPAIVESLDLHGLAGRARRARRMVEQHYTIDAYAHALAEAYDAAASVATV